MASIVARQHFEDKAAAYERASGGCTSLVAAQLASLSEQVDQDSHILDLAAGPGIVIDELLRCPESKHGSQKATYTVVDSAPAMIDIVKFKVHSKWNIPEENVTMIASQAEDLNLTESSLTHCFCNFGFMFFADPIKVAQHIHQALKPGRRALVTTFAYIGYVPVVARASEHLRPGKEVPKLPFSDDWWQGSHLANVMRTAGFQNVEVSTMDCPMLQASVKVIAQNITNRFEKTCQALGWTEEQMARLPQVLEAELSEDEVNVDVQGDGVKLKMVANIAVCVR